MTSSSLEIYPGLKALIPAGVFVSISITCFFTSSLQTSSYTFSILLVLSVGGDKNSSSPVYCL